MTKSSRRKRPPQMSLGFMMLMMIVFAVLSAGLFYAANVPVVQEELGMLFGTEIDRGDAGAGRWAHIVFIMFTFSSPLLLAGTLSTLLNLYRWYERR